MNLKKIPSKICQWVVIPYLLWVTTFVSGIPQTISITATPLISSQRRLEEVVNRELNKRKHPEDIKIIPQLSYGGECRKLSENEYILKADTEGAVKHELHHILNGHLNRGNLDDRKGVNLFLGYVLYFSYYEPMAALAGLGLIE